MHIDDDVELVRERLLDGPVHPLGELGLDRVRSKGLRVGGPFDRQPDGVEAGLLDRPEVIRLKSDALLSFPGGFKGVPQVDASAELLVRGVDVGLLLGRCRSDRQRGCRSSQDAKDERMLHGETLLKRGLEVGLCDSSRAARYLDHTPLNWTSAFFQRKRRPSSIARTACCNRFAPAMDLSGPLPGILGFQETRESLQLKGGLGVLRPMTEASAAFLGVTAMERQWRLKKVLAASVAFP